MKTHKFALFLCAVLGLFSLAAQIEAADCTFGLKFVNDGPCTVRFTATTNNGCAISSTVVPPGWSAFVQGSNCCFEAVEVEIIGDCQGIPGGTTYYTEVGFGIVLPGPYSALSLDECEARIF